MYNRDSSLLKHLKCTVGITQRALECQWHFMGTCSSQVGDTLTVMLQLSQNWTASHVILLKSTDKNEMRTALRNCSRTKNDE